MIKLMAIYFQPEAGETFDEKYYTTKHLPLVKKTLPGVAGTYYAKAMPTPAGDKPSVVGIGIVEWADIESFKRAMSSPGLQEIRADHANYSTCKSEIITVTMEKID